MKKTKLTKLAEKAEAKAYRKLSPVLCGRGWQRLSDLDAAGYADIVDSEGVVWVKFPVSVSADPAPVE